jgi:uncharacterized protein with HEPN domain
MSQIRDDAWLLDIINAIHFVTEYASTVSEDIFSVDHATQNVIIREITVIGEAVRRLSPGFVAAHPEIPFAPIIAMRNALIHDYDDISLKHVWDSVHFDLPILLQTIEPIFSRMRKGSSLRE